MLNKRERELRESESGEESYYYYTEEDESHGDTDDESHISESDVWTPDPMYEGPYCHEEVWEGPESLERCRICMKMKDQPPPSIEIHEADDDDNRIAGDADAWMQVLPRCHEEIWEGPESLEKCHVCMRMKDQAPPSTVEDVDELPNIQIMSLCVN